jgi:hypothetical protein
MKFLDVAAVDRDLLACCHASREVSRYVSLTISFI